MRKQTTTPEHGSLSGASDCSLAERTSDVQDDQTPFEPMSQFIIKIDIETCAMLSSGTGIASARSFWKSTTASSPRT